ncbi:hypothetical protein HanXRQr2_Chr08g0320611 [Helianthus annuus]|uniref:Uncharacterized protein n=1 Tax=Helianthus annuus TaxID=4232 RepID=A0A251U2G2_HELAN|nr:hypothetical protein HanXRQr2_Chr08g0320611 [Helianthus annuus]
MRLKGRVVTLHGSSAILTHLGIASCTKSICVWIHQVRASLIVRSLQQGVENWPVIVSIRGHWLLTANTILGFFPGTRLVSPLNISLINSTFHLFFLHRSPVKKT